MICPKCKQQYDIYSAAINDWECPDCHVVLKEEAFQMQDDMTIECEIIERCIQLCLLERDKADKKEPDPPGSTMNKDFISGQSWMANLIAKKLRAIKEKIMIVQTEYERRESIETDRLEDDYSNYRNNEICEQRLREAK